VKPPNPFQAEPPDLVEIRVSIRQKLGAPIVDEPPQVSAK
jgi:hypothetical protein